MNDIRAIYKAKVMHKRLYPKVNAFTYLVFYIFFDIEKIDSLKSKLFSLNKFNLFSFYNKDHGNKDNKSLTSWIKNILKENNLNIDGKIFLLTHPRILGYVFNPVSFWFCFNKKQELQAVLAEVNNTFKESHNYLIFCRNGNKIDANKFYEANKEFHVSPFIKREGLYKFRFQITDNQIGVVIDLFNQDKKILTTSIAAKKQEFCDLFFARNILFLPILALKVIFLIHFQAIKLLFKNIKYIKKPQKFSYNLTKVK